MFAVTAILSCIIKIRGLFKSTKWRHSQNVKPEALSCRREKEINEETTTTIDKSKWVSNLSTYNITEDERELLENGMKRTLNMITLHKETKRTLNIRAKEHITAIKSASKRSHTAEHCRKYSHDFDWKHKKVLDFEKNWKTRTIKEAI